jgi:cbb3-type cytochrome oxidase subunit 1
VTATDSDAGTGAPSAARDTAARLHLLVAAAFLLVGAASYMAVAAKLVWPEFLAGSAELSYGRLLPVATSALLYGWLMVAFLGAAYYVVPRESGTRLRGGPLPLLSLVLVAGGVAAGIAGVLTGRSAGGRYLELPLWADAVVVAGLLLTAVTLTRTARAAGDVPVPVWYLVGGSWWLVASWGVGMIPVGGGVPSAVQGWFAVTAFSGLWLAAAGIGVGYHLVARLVPDVVFHPRLGRIGFWSLAFAWAWTAGRHLQYGPTPDWAETVPVVFAAGLVVAVITIVADLVLALRGRWAVVRSSAPLRFFVAGLVLFLLVPFHVMVSSLRGASTVVHLTAWETAFEQLMVFGPFFLWAAAAAAHVLPAAGRTWGRRFAGTTLLLAVAGLATTLTSRWLAGLQQGYTWVAGSETGDFENFGDGFRNSVSPLEGLQAAQFVGIAVLGAAVVLLVVGVVRHALGSGDAPEAAGDAEMPRAPLRAVLTGAAALFVVSAVAVAVMPALEAEEPASLLALASRSYPESSLEERGAELYVAEGCWYCHTQQVRPIVTDAGLGPVSVPGDYAYDHVDVLGLERIGPDLAHAGTRAPTEDVSWNVAHLRDPRSMRPWSTMPDFGHLADEDLDALAAYVASLD